MAKYPVSRISPTEWVKILVLKYYFPIYIVEDPPVPVCDSGMSEVEHFTQLCQLDCLMCDVRLAVPHL